MSAHISGIWRYRELVRNLAGRQIKLRYRKSVLGWFWSLATPAATLGIYTLVFGEFLDIQPPVGGNGELRSFAIFLLVGLVAWNFFESVVAGSMAWLLESGPLLKKTYFPPELTVFAGSGAMLVQTLTEVGILLAALIWLGNISLTVLLLPFLLLLLLLFSMGVGLVASLMNVYFRDISYLVQIGLKLLFYATPIVYPFSEVPRELGGVPVAALISINPLTQFVGAFRDALYELQAPSAGRLGALVAISVISFVGGWWLFTRRSEYLSEEL